VKSRIFPNLPDALDGFSTDELQSKIDEFKTLVRKIALNDVELLPADQFSADDVLAEMQHGAEQIKVLEAELALRSEAEGRFASEVARIAAESGVELTDEGDAGDDDSTEDGDDDDATDEAATETDEAAADEATAEETTDAVTAAAPLRRPIPRPTADREAVAVETEDRPPTLVAAAGLHGIEPGRELDRVALGAAMIEGRRRNLNANGRIEVVVASVTKDYPESRKLYASDPEGNAEKVRTVVSPEALVASGGLCAPLTPIYELPQISTEARPLRDALPPFMADRGGITWATPPSIADVTDAVGIVTAAEDAEGGTFATKSCQSLACEDFNSAEVAAIYHCLLWGNLGSRAWPERVAQFTDVVMAAFSRLAETNILNLMVAGSTQVTAAQATYGYGALSSWTSEILVAAAAYRSRFRMDPNARFRIVAPSWARDLILSDLINAQFDRFAIQGYAGVDAFLQQRGVDPVWTLDGETSGGQVFAAQGAGALLHFPTNVKWFLFPEGTWIFLDAGVLELGIVRDSVLNATNDFEVFGESFETIAQVGYQSLEITSALCPSGTTGGPATAITCA
jgi:hypothetical protein